MSQKDKEPDLIKKMQNTQKGLIGGLYQDLFGGNIKKPETEGGSVPDFFAEPPKAPDAVTEDIALKNAQDALREARELLTSLPDLNDLADSIGKLSSGQKEDEIRKAAEDEFRKRAGLKEESTPAEPAASLDSTSAQEEKKQEPEQDPMEQLESLIGLTTIKRDVKELTDFAKIQKLRKDEGLKSVPVSLHLVFTGNPGTGKTTVARILGKLYRQIGILEKGQLVEVDRSGLVAGYVGQTAIKTSEKIKEAMGGVLFIDEAYALSQKDDAFGQEAIDTILKAMEDHRDEFVVIVAGYTAPMEKFINSNPGLKSRFNKYIEFPDYTVDELEQIFDLNCKKYDYSMDDQVRFQIREQIKLRKLASPENFANAREVRNLFEQIITNQARRVALLENPSHDDMTAITLEDLIETEEENVQLS